MIAYHVVRFHHAGTLTDYDILSSWDTLALARLALSVAAANGSARFAIIGPVPRDHS